MKEEKEKRKRKKKNERGCFVDLLLRKFSNLKMYYRRERKKYLTLKSGSSGIVFQPRWEHFSRLSFLDDSCIAEETRSNIALPETPDEQSLAKCEDAGDENICNITATSIVADMSNVTPGRKRKRQAGEALTELTACLKKLNEEKEDAEEAFGHYIAQELKSITDVAKRDFAKLKIQTLLYEFKYSA